MRPKCVQNRLKPEAQIRFSLILLGLRVSWKMLREFEVSAPLRSAQSGRPTPDVLRRLVLLPKAQKHCKINASGFFAESKDIRTI